MMPQLNNSNCNMRNTVAADGTASLRDFKIICLHIRKTGKHASMKEGKKEREREGGRVHRGNAKSVNHSGKWAC